MDETAEREEVPLLTAAASGVASWQRPGYQRGLIAGRFFFPRGRAVRKSFL